MKTIKMKIIGLLLIFSVSTTMHAMQSPIAIIEQRWYEACMAYRDGLIPMQALVSVLRNVVVQYLHMLEKSASDDYAFMLFKLRTADYIGIPNLYQQLVWNINHGLYIQSNDATGELYSGAYSMIKDYILDHYQQLEEAKASGLAKDPKAS